MWGDEYPLSFSGASGLNLSSDYWYLQYNNAEADGAGNFRGSAGILDYGSISDGASLGRDNSSKAAALHTLQSDASNFNLVLVGAAYYTNMVNIERTYLYTQIYPIDVDLVALDIPSLFVQVSADKYGQQLNAEWAMSNAYNRTLNNLQKAVSSKEVNSLSAANKYFLKEFKTQLKSTFGGLPIIRVTPFSGDIPKSNMKD